jgi:hypothetical protein
MSIIELICHYCSHRNTGADSRCGHCGAPLPSGHPAATVADHLVRAEQVVTGAAKAAAATETAVADAEKVAAEQYPKWQWAVAAAAVAALIAALGIAVTQLRSVPLVSMSGLDAATVLPVQLRSAASCQRVDTAAETCVIRADHPLLTGGITGGKELTLSVALDPPDRRAEAVRTWRAAGGTVLVDGPVFAAVSPSATLRYANTVVGLRFETSAFVGRAGAQTFLTRVGLPL